MTDYKARRDIAPKLTFREWTKAVIAMERQSKFHVGRMNDASFPMLKAYHWEQSMICDRIVMELKRAQAEGGNDE